MTSTIPWGSYAPSGFPLFLRCLIRSGVSRGHIRKFVQRLWILSKGSDRPVDIDYHGIKLRLIPDRNVTDEKLLFRSGVRDAEDIGWLRNYAGGDSVFLDIGANIGYYSLSAAKMGFGKLIAIEPNPELLGRLRFNIEANGLSGRVTVVPVAVSDQPGEMLFDSTGDMGSGHVVKPGVDARGFPVRVECLADVLLRERIRRVTAFKIDVEGHEDKALLPYLKSLPDEDLPKLGIIEYIHSGDWSEDLTAYMLVRGYRTVLRNRSNIILHRA